MVIDELLVEEKELVGKMILSWILGMGEMIEDVYEV